MTFERVEKGLHRNRVGPMQISIAKTLANFGEDITIAFAKTCFVEVYLDRSENLVGFRACTDNITGFRLLKSQTRIRGITGKFLKMLPVGIYHAELQDDMYVVRVVEIAKDIETEK